MVNIGKFWRAGRQSFCCCFFYSSDIANQGFAIFPMKVKKYIIKVKNFASLLFRLINANISVNEQPEWFHWAHRRWPFYAHCTSHTRFRSWSFYRYRKRFWWSRSMTLTDGKNIEKAWLHFISANFENDQLFTITKISISWS